MQFSIVALLVCFPFWLVFSWFYDLTDEGIVRTSSIEDEDKVVSTKSVNLNKLIISSLAIIVILLIVNTFIMKVESNKVILSAGNRDVTTSEALNTPKFNSSVAVLAFADMSPEQDHQFFADGLSEEIIHQLNRVKDLRVPSRTSSFSFRNQEVTHQTIAEELDVDYILEGSVRISNDIFRITAQLIDGSDGSHVWSQTFDREIEDVLYTQGEIAMIVADLLEVSLLFDDVRLRKVDPEAYTYYLKANESLNKYDKNSTLEADSLIHLSLDIDNSYAPAWTTLSRVIFKKTYHYFLVDPRKGHDEGVKAAIKAVELDKEYAMAYAWLSRFEWQNKNAEKAEIYLNTALKLSPKDPDILFQAANFTLRTNRLESARKYLKNAMLMDPDNPGALDSRDRTALYSRSFLYWTLGNLKQAEKDLIMAYDLGLPDYFRIYEMALLQRDMGNYEEALQWMEKENNQYLKDLLQCSIYYAMGKKQESREMLEALNSYPKDEHMRRFIDTEGEHHYELAILYAFMDDYDNAFVHLDLAFETIVIWPNRLFTTPEFNVLKSDLRWEGLLIRLGNELGYNFIQE